MKVQDLVEELQESQEYKTFQEQNPDTFFAAAFLILDIENKTEQIQLDYFLPQQNRVCPNQDKTQISEGRIAAFSHPFAEPKIHDEIISIEKGQTTPAKVPAMIKQTTQIKIDIDDLEPKCKELIKENNSFIAPTKIIAILKDDIWNLTCMDDMLGIVRVKINAVSGEVQDFNKGGLMDFMGIKKK